MIYTQALKQGRIEIQSAGLGARATGSRPHVNNWNIRQEGVQAAITTIQMSTD